MRKVMVFLLLFSLSFFTFSIHTNAEIVIDPGGGIKIPVGGNKPIYNIRYDVMVLYLDITTSDGLHTVAFPVNGSIFWDDTIHLTRAQVENALGSNGAEIISDLLDGRGGTIDSRGEIKIFNGTTRQALAYFRQEGDIERIARNRFGFSNVPPPNSSTGRSDLENMHRWFNFDILSMLLEEEPPTPKLLSHMELVASLEELQNSNNPGSEPWLDPNNLKTKLAVKSGYGIPLVAQLQGFHFTEAVRCPRTTQRSYADDFKINSVVLTVTSTLNDFWMKDYPNKKKNSGIDVLEAFSAPYKIGQDCAKFTFKKNNYSTIGARKIYTDPLQKDSSGEDGNKIIVTAVTDATWTEYNIHKGCYKYKCALGHTHIRHNISEKTHHVTYTNSTEDAGNNPLRVYIQDSMFDDDQTILKR